jgi:hypothetical protein
MMGRRAFIDAAALASNDAHRAAVAQGLAGVGGTGTSDANRGARLRMNGGYWQAFGLKKHARVACQPACAPVRECSKRQTSRIVPVA